MRTHIRYYENNLQRAIVQFETARKFNLNKELKTPTNRHKQNTVSPPMQHPGYSLMDLIKQKRLARSRCKNGEQDNVLKT
ncbi:hypothetical protein M0802_009103 [Mischocyttarus mexicanus]|nr:hypothetical protein M0802_009103 [Mischocyttarus mexicanus]